MSRIVVTRNGDGRFWRHSVFLGDEEVALVRRGKSVTIEVEPGEYTLHIRNGRHFQSPTVSVNLAPGEEAHFTYTPDLRGREEFRQRVSRDREERPNVRVQYASSNWFVLVRES
jgi:hypothetical protein